MKNSLKKLDLIPDKIDLISLLSSYILINFTFLFHTLNFMWGNHDVKFIKEKVFLDTGLFEGRFTQFIPHWLLTNEQILPIIINLLGFAFLSIALWILAKYWNIPKSKLNYFLFISFTATQPYTLSWLYFSFYTISCLLWALLAILGLYLSEKICQNSSKLIISAISIICFYLTLGGYPPIINTFAVCLLGKIIISYTFEKKSINELINIHKYTISNILIAAILYKITLAIIQTDDVYNLQTTPLNELPQKFIHTLKIAFSQFFITIPFMEKGYKLLLFIMSLFSFSFTIFEIKNKRQILFCIILIIITIWSTSLTTFLVIPPTEFVSRIDFYGYGFLYALFLSLLLQSKYKLSKSMALIFMIIIIPLNILNNYQALLIWKQGFDAEFQIIDRIAERIENHPNFNPNKKYRYYQIGDISLRPKYYPKNFNKDDVFLYSIPYFAIWQGANLMEFYSPFSFINHNTTILAKDITPDVYNHFLNEVKPWPHHTSVFINDNIIIITLNSSSLYEFRQKIKQLYP